MKTSLSARAAVSILLLASLAAGAALAEIPDKFTNLEVFPQDIGKRALMGTMKNFSSALGVKCTFCHVQKTPGDFDSIDWASDELEHKKVTRGMMKMVGGINGDLLPAATGGESSSVSCVTCHRGLADPRTLDSVLLDTMAKDGVEAGLVRYGELKEDYYGSGSYDFSTGMLLTVAQTLAQDRGDVEGAVQVLDLALELDPENEQIIKIQNQLKQE